MLKFIFGAVAFFILAFTYMVILPSPKHKKNNKD